MHGKLRLKVERQIGQENGHLDGQVKGAGNVQLDGGNVLDANKRTGVVNNRQVYGHLEGDAVRAVALGTDLRSRRFRQLVGDRFRVRNIRLEGHFLLK